MTREQHPYAAGQRDSSNDSLAAAAFLRKSRFQTCGLVIDLRDAELLSAVRRTIESHDALGAIKATKAAGLPYVVMAGHLARKRGGVIAIGTDGERLQQAVMAVCERIAQVGETCSLWIVTLAEPVRSEVEACLASYSTVEGCA